MLGLDDYDTINQAVHNSLPTLRSSTRRIVAHPPGGGPPYDFETVYKSQGEGVQLTGLSSATGLTLNGAYGTIISMDGLVKHPVTGVAMGLAGDTNEDGFRVFVRLDKDPNRVVKVKIANIRLRNIKIPVNTPELSDESVMSNLEWVITQGPHRTIGTQGQGPHSTGMTRTSNSGFSFVDHG